VCRCNWHSAGSPGWPFPTLKYKYIFKYNIRKLFCQTALGDCYGLKLPKCWLQFKNVNLLCRLSWFSAHFRSLVRHGASIVKTCCQLCSTKVDAQCNKLTGSWPTSPAGWLPRTGISSGTLRSAIEYGLPLPFYCVDCIEMLRNHLQLHLYCCTILLSISPCRHLSPWHRRTTNPRQIEVMEFER